MSETNVVTEFAAAGARAYITPEDVATALTFHPADRVRRDVLAVLGRQAKFGAEDAGLCAFIAWRGTP